MTPRFRNWMPYIVEHTPSGTRPNFRLLAWRVRRAEKLRESTGVLEARLSLAWYRWHRRRRMGRI